MLLEDRVPSSFYKFIWWHEYFLYLNEIEVFIFKNCKDCAGTCRRKFRKLHTNARMLQKTPQNFPMHLFVPISEILDSEQMSTKLIYEECTSQNSKNGSMKKKFRLLLWEKILRLMPKEKKLTNSTRKFKWRRWS